MKLGIRFSDNDFAATVLVFLNLYLDHQWPKRLHTKSELYSLWNKSIGGIYQITQGNLEDFDESYFNKVEFYLNSEVDTYITKCGGWDNLEFHVLDTTPYTPYIYSI